MVSMIWQAATNGGGGGEASVPLSYVVLLITGFCGVIGTLAGILWRRVENENKELRLRLARYEDVAPRYIESRARPRAPRRASRLPSPYHSEPQAGRRRR